jgi:glutamate formiminotransferase/formiminotetrahydrofolate cyclodeaminase
VPVKDVVETAVQSMGLRDVAAFDATKSVLGLPTTDGTLASMPVNGFADEVSRASPAPGGGSIAALAGSLAAALASMVANLSFTKKGMEELREEMEGTAMRCQELKDRLLRAIDADTDAFNHVLEAMRLPKGSDEEKAARDAAIQEGYKLATAVPYETAQTCLAAMRECRAMAEKGLAASVSDAGVGALMARAGVLGAVYNVRINLPSITDTAWVAEQAGKLDALVSEAEGLEGEVRALVESHLTPGA